MEADPPCAGRCAKGPALGDAARDFGAPRRRFQRGLGPLAYAFAAHGCRDGDADDACIWLVEVYAFVDRDGAWALARVSSAVAAAGGYGGDGARARGASC